jgi:hypothetical protein
MTPSSQPAVCSHERVVVTTCPTKDSGKFHQQEIEENCYVVRMWLLAGLGLRPWPTALSGSVHDGDRASHPIGSQLRPAMTTGSRSSSYEVVHRILLGHRRLQLYLQWCETIIQWVITSSDLGDHVATRKRAGAACIGSGNAPPILRGSLPTNSSIDKLRSDSCRQQAELKSPLWLLSPNVPG